MNQTLDMLKNIIAKQTEIYQKLLELAMQKTDVLIAGDTDALDTIVKKEEAAMKKLSILESARENVVREYARAHALSPGGLTISEIAAKADDMDKKELSALADELRTVLAALSDINVRNRSLIDTHLRYSAFCVEMLTGMNASGVYTSTGDANEEKMRKHMLFDQRA